MLTLEEKATNFDTMRHIERVRNLLNQAVVELLDRGKKHDQSKLDHPEVEAFTKYTPMLASTTFGSAEYEAAKQAMRPALDHHYAHASHHPESFLNGIEDMNLIDILEMFVDWKASSERHNDGDIVKSIEINSKRFVIGDQLKKILENSVDLFK